MSFTLNEMNAKLDEPILSGLKVANLECGSPLMGCSEGTREDILKNIDEWSTNFDAPNILWVKGQPGVGKSAIATDVVKHLLASKRLGSEFFFQRQASEVMTPNALWRIVAHNLSLRYPTIRSVLVSTLKSGNVNPMTPNIDLLFRHLIYEPLMQSSDIPDGRLPIIVIDGLDECGGLDGPRSKHRRNLVRTLKNWSRLPGKFKLIVTSRDESDIEELFLKTDHHYIDILAEKSSEDIQNFFAEQLRQIAAGFKLLPLDWPGSERVKELSDMSGGLFIWADTVIEFIRCGSPEPSLRRVLAGIEGSGGLNTLYNTVLHISFGKSSKEDIKNILRVVGTTILARSALSLQSIARLHSLEESTVEYIYKGLQSVMEYENGLRFRHQSFVDFLIDPDKCSLMFLIKRKEESQALTLGCLRVMKDLLRFNICNVKSSYLRNSDIQDLGSQEKECIPPYLFYSCRFWTSHLAETGFDTDVLGHIEYFMRNQFLFWLEILSITRQVNVGSNMLSLLIDWIPVSSWHTIALNGKLTQGISPTVKGMRCQWQ